MRNFRKIALSVIGICALAISGLANLAPAQAQISGITVDFAAAEPLTYNHATGGGKWGAGKVNFDIERSLEGESFACGDTVSYLTKVSAANTSGLRAFGEMTLDLKYSFTLDSTGQSGVALGEPFVTVLTTGDSATNYDAGSAVTTTSITQSGPVFKSGSKLFTTVRLTNFEAGEIIVVRNDVRILCKSGSRPTGNLQAKFEEGFLVAKSGNVPVNPVEDIGSGARTVDLKNIGDLSSAELYLAKTVTTQGGSCPGSELITIEPDEVIRYCYVITNPSNSGGRTGAPVYNLSSIYDDNGKYPDFVVTAISGLSDVDGDGQVDDLAAGAIATAYYEIALDGDQDSLVRNIATVSGYNAPTNGTLLTAEDVAEVFVDAPGIVTGLSINKVTNGSDGPTILAGSAITWKYTVTNEGNVDLTNVYVLDDQGVTVNCPNSLLAIGASMDCTATGSAIIGSYSNIGTAYGSYETSTVTANDPSYYFGANPGVEIDKSPDSQVVVEGDTATFTIVVTNTGNVPLSQISVVDIASPDCDRTIGTLNPAATFSYTCTSSPIYEDLRNVAVVTGSWNDLPYLDEDDADIKVDYLPKISVEKSADKTTALETGESVTFTVVVTNDAPEDFTLTSLVDNIFGDLDEVGSCSIPQTIAAGASYSCSFSKFLAADDLARHTNTATANGVDPEQHPATGSDDATVTFIDVLPDITLSKEANPTQARWNGDYIDYTFKISNVGTETVTVTSFSDDKFTLSSTCLALIGQSIAPAGYLECSLLEQLVTGEPGGSFTNTATAVAEDNEMNSDTASASAVVKFFPADPKIEIAKDPDSQIVKEGETATFTIVVTNTGNVPLSSVTVADAASPDCNRNIGALGLEATFSYTCSSPALSADLENVAIASGNWKERVVTDTDTATVTVDLLPKISVLKSADKSSVKETGESVTFTVQVKNDAAESFSLTSLVDDKFGNLAGVGTCALPQTIAAGASYSCSFNKFLAADDLAPHTNTVTASGVDPQGNPASQSDDATVTFIDVLPDITLSKVVSPTAARWTGDYVNYTFKITNVGTETVTVTAFSDDKFTLSSTCLALIGQSIAPGGNLQCTLLNQFVSGSAGGSLTNTATAVAKDNEMNSDTASASAVVKFWWFGRTPGYWKNHPEAWVSGYTPNMFIESVFTIPSALFTGGFLNLDGKSGKDTLMNGLSYKGGSDLKGGAQILLRAAIAALLNEAYYGSDFPAAGSKAELITLVNQTLTKLDRSKYIELAGLLDYWNNAVHASLP